MAKNHSNTTILEDQTIAKAMCILQRRMRYHSVIFSSATSVCQFLSCWFADEEREVFCVLWLDIQNRLIKAENLFFGTLTQTSVYPREVVKRALQMNAASVIFSHNHPSGVADPSSADEVLTKALKRTLALIDVKVLDHIIVAGADTRSFAEMGML